jgi:GntR family transcriptional regulator
MLNHNSPIPIYVQLKDILYREITDGKYKPGDKLPSELDLCNIYGVSRITVRQAINLLIQKDMVYSVHGKGSFVKTPSIRQDLDRIIRFGSTLQQEGLYGYTKVASFDPNVSFADARAVLGTDYSNMNIIGYAADMPIVYYRSYIINSIAGSMYRTALEIERERIPFSSYDLYDRLNIKLHRVEQTIGAMSADKKLKEIFGSAYNGAFLVLESTYYSDGGEPLELKTAYYRADVYSFQLHREF